MIEVFNAIQNIVIKIENEVFSNYDRFVDKKATDKEVEKKVYNFCTEVIESECEDLKSVQSVISKDKKQMCMVHETGKYIISYSAIDNVELLDMNFSLGSIFAVYENEIAPQNLQASVYATYGPTFQIVFASKQEGVKYFSYEHGEFVQKDNLLLKEKGKINTPAGGFNHYNEQNMALAQKFFDQGYRLRFSNSLCLDTHQILFKQGGVYMSPSSSLEAVFEAFPIAFIIELADGIATDGSQRILELDIKDIHQTTSMYFGSKTEMDSVTTFLNS
jgi:fructose-1,6-bisphosphatase I